MTSDICDQLDRQLARCLQINGRASFSQIATVLGVSDQTVARRYARLRSTGSLRVQGLTSPYLGGRAPWVLRVRCEPTAAPRVAGALALRDDTAWVHLTSAGTEVVCMVTTLDRDNESLLLDLLPRTPRVQSVNAHYLLRTFSRGLHKVIAGHSGLSSDQVQALGPGHDAARSQDLMTQLDDADRLLLRALAQDGRTALASLEAVVGRPRAAVRRRMDELIRAGVLFFDVDVDQRLFPVLSAWSLLWLSVDPAHLDTVGRALAEHPEIAFAAATTGATNIYAGVTTPGPPDLYTYITRRIAQLPGIGYLETAPILRNVKHHG